MARVLVVDDDAIGLEIRKLILERAGHLVTAATDVETARRLFCESRPESVVLDLRIPELADGLALIREFRHASDDPDLSEGQPLRREGDKVQIIVLSGWSSALLDLPEAAMVDLILTKPVRSEQLLSAIASGKPSLTG